MNNLMLNTDGKFKGKSWGLKEVETIYDNAALNLTELGRLTGLSESTVSRIKKGIIQGSFNKFLNGARGTVNTSEHDDKTVNIYDGIHITVYNENHPAERSVEENKRINSIQLSAWSKKVKKRGRYICAKCGRVDTEHSQAHHIYPKSKYPSLACDMGNGIVLCQSCHAHYHNKHKDNENPYSLVGWLNEDS